MIKSFKDAETKKITENQRSRRLPGDIQRRAKMRLDRINAAVSLEDLTVPPSHNLEALKGDRKGQHGIRINDQWRVCFKWKDGDAYDVEIVDYH